MPYHWSNSENQDNLTLWPHQSLTPVGFSWFIGATAVMLALPLFAVLGSPVAWVLMLFFGAALAAVWRAIFANKRHRSTQEVLTVADAHVSLTHQPARGPHLTWEANPHWVTVNIREDGPVEKYLTLRGGGREVELGSFLTPEERQSLFSEIQAKLNAH